MSKWITDRRPTAADADGCGHVWNSMGQCVLYGDVAHWEPWMPTNRPEPYVKPKRYKVKMLTVERWCVIDSFLRDFVAKYLPTEEAANRILAIYEEVMP